MKSAVLLDMNGVLVDDEELHYRAFVRVLESAGFTLGHDDYLHHFAGRTDMAGFNSFLAARAPEKSLKAEQLVSEKAIAYRAMAAVELRQYDHAGDKVRELHMAGHQLALVTSSSRAEADTVLELLGVEQVLDVVVTAESVDEGKPSPEPYLRAAAELRRDPASCVVVEDSPSGVASANRAGAWCIAVTTTHSSEQLAGADLVLGGIGELSSDVVERLIS